MRTSASAPAQNCLQTRTAGLNDVEAGFYAEVEQMREDFADLFRRLEYKRAPDERAPFIIDGRWAAIAKTQLQQGMMALDRAILRTKEF
ncbi:Acb2/Tad1 domain-containing protein [Sphingomonas sp. ACRSK]|uniref:Acb2/Tad1 domain-containing protein n=1 Tax=Sphingomonas sp. ACRSK TaxID=2918213 RepID=UPI001EF60AF2|nr:hypothetical protein [Sphingomonas sp. ACRSK]MCG7348886.1 hypothetical protein [Sphingomonas sp. ACRSK]